MKLYTSPIARRRAVVDITVDGDSRVHITVVDMLHLSVAYIIYEGESVKNRIKKPIVRTEKIKCGYDDTLEISLLQTSNLDDVIDDIIDRLSVAEYCPATASSRDCDGFIKLIPVDKKSKKLPYKHVDVRMHDIEISDIEACTIPSTIAMMCPGCSINWNVALSYYSWNTNGEHTIVKGLNNLLHDIEVVDKMVFTLCSHISNTFVVSTNSSKNIKGIVDDDF